MWKIPEESLLMQPFIMAKEYFDLGVLKENWKSAAI